MLVELDSPRYTIARYPAQLIDRLQLADGRTVTIRPVLPQDATLTRDFVARLSPRSRYLRFHLGVAELPPRLVREFTEIDYAGHLGLLATHLDAEGEEVLVADARYVVDADGREAEFAVAVTDGWQRVGLGSDLIARLTRIARARGLTALRGEVVAGNAAMLALLRRIGARLQSVPGQATLVEARIELAPQAARPTD